MTTLAKRESRRAAGSSVKTELQGRQKDSTTFAVSARWTTAHELLAAVDDLHPIDRDRFVAAIEESVVDEVDSSRLWQELVDRHDYGSIDLAAIVARWLADSWEDREFVLGKLAEWSDPKAAP